MRYRSTWIPTPTGLIRVRDAAHWRELHITEWEEQKPLSQSAARGATIKLRGGVTRKSA